MKTRPTVKIIAVVLATAAVLQAEKAQPRDPNPTKDPDVQRGYDQHQREHNKTCQPADTAKPAQTNNGNYEVNKSKDTAKGTPPKSGK